MGLVGTETKALAVLWLQELVDDEERDIRIPLLVGKDLKQLRQNVSVLESCFLPSEVAFVF